MTTQQKVTYIPWKALDEFQRRVLEKGGLSREHARIVSDNLTQANLRGVDTHGSGLLPNYYRRLKEGGINPEANVRIVKESPAVVIVDGDAGPGQVATQFAMQKAIEKARVCGIGWAEVVNSNHHGALAYYSLMAAEQDMIGITFTGAYPSIAPWGGKQRLIGNNPLAIAAPVDGEKPLVLDMAMSVRANGQLRLAQERGTPLGEGQALDKDGNPTSDWKAAAAGSLLPFGGYKGSGLTLMLELMAAVMGGGPHTTQMNMNARNSTPSRTGHSLAALNISFFSDVAKFKREAAAIAKEWRSSEKRPGFSEVLTPGEKEWRFMAEREKKGIPLYAGSLKILQDLGKEAGVPFPG